MIRVLIDDDNAFYREGLWHFIKKNFTSSDYGTLELLETSQENLAASDIVVKIFQNGGTQVCHHELLHRKANSLLIAVCSEAAQPPLSRLPDCLKSVLFVSRREALNALSLKVLQAWKHVQFEEERVRNCQECQALYFSPQEEKVVRYICLGFSVERIAWILSLNIKTVSSHKRSVMHKFNLNSDAELLTLMKLYEERLTYVSGRRRLFYLNTPAVELNNKRRLHEKLIHTVAL